MNGLVHPLVLGEYGGLAYFMCQREIIGQCPQKKTKLPLIREATGDHQLDMGDK